MKRLSVGVLLLALAGCGGPSPTDETDAGVPIETGTIEATRTRITTAPATTTTQAPPTVAAVGDTAEVQSQNGSANVTLNSAQRVTEPPEFGSPPDNGVYLVLDVTIVGVSGEVEVNPAYFSAQGADGYVYDATFGGFDPLLPSQPVVAPGMVRGKATIDVPPGPLAVSFTTPLGDPLVTFQVP